MKELLQEIKVLKSRYRGLSEENERLVSVFGSKITDALIAFGDILIREQMYFFIQKHWNRMGGYYGCASKNFYLCPNCNRFSELKTGNNQWGVDNPKSFGTRLVLKNGPYGKFWGCESFPECKYTSPTFETILERQKRKGRNAIAYAIGESCPDFIGNFGD